MPRAPRKRLANGRPVKHIDWDVVDKMLIAGCHGTSIASKFNMHPQTFYDRCFHEKGIGFTEYSRKKEDEGNDLIRQVRFSKAMKGDNTMLIWLSKTRLGESETQIIKTEEIKSQKAILNLPDNGRRTVNKVEDDEQPTTDI